MRWRGLIIVGGMLMAGFVRADVKAPEVEAGRVALRVVDGEGKAVDVAYIREITVQIAQGPWILGRRPAILKHDEGGWMEIDAKQVVLAQVGQKVTVYFTSKEFGAMTARGKFAGKGQPVVVSLEGPAWAEGVAETTEVKQENSDDLVGKVVDASGAPVAGARAFYPHLFDFHREPSDVTKGDGVFKLAHGNTWFTVLQIEKDGFAPRWITSGPREAGLLVRLDNTTRVKGKLTLPDGSPAAKASITAVTSKPTLREGMMNPIHPIRLTRAADAEGKYDIALEPGEYEFQIECGKFSRRDADVEIGFGKVTALAEKLEVSPAVTMRMVDSITKKAVPGVEVWIEDDWPGETGQKEGSIRNTDADGVAKWESVMPGTWRFGVMKKGYCRWSLRGPQNPRRDRRGIDSLAVDVQAETDEVVVEMDPGFTVAGTLMTPDGKAVGGAQVNMSGLRTGDARYMVKSDAEGKFSITVPVLTEQFQGAQGGGYAVVAQDPQKRFANALSKAYAPAAGKTVETELRFTEGGYLTGRLIDLAGNGAADVDIQGSAEDERDAYYFDPRGKSDAKGLFKLGPMRAGKYQLLFGRQDRIGGQREKKSAEVREGGTVDVGDVEFTGKK